MALNHFKALHFRARHFWLRDLIEVVTRAIKGVQVYVTKTIAESQVLTKISDAVVLRVVNLSSVMLPKEAAKALSDEASATAYILRQHAHAMLAAPPAYATSSTAPLTASTPRDDINTVAEYDEIIASIGDDTVTVTLRRIT